jgi:hypothetical protein
MNSILSHCTKIVLLVLVIALPVCSLAADFYSSTFTNQSKQYDPQGNGYILQHAATWGNDCLLNEGKRRLKPGESSLLKIKKTCEWAGVKYKILNKHDTIGFVSHSYRNKKFTVEVSSACIKDTCTFTGMPPLEK